MAEETTGSCRLASDLPTYTVTHECSHTYTLLLKKNSEQNNTALRGYTSHRSPRMLLKPMQMNLSFPQPNFSEPERHRSHSCWKGPWPVQAGRDTENCCHSKHLAPLYLSSGEVWLRHPHTYKPPGPKQQKSKARRPLCYAADRLINYTQTSLKKEYFLFPASRIGKASSGRNRFVMNIQNTKEGGAWSPTLPGLSNLGQQLKKNNPPFENVQWCQAQDLVHKFLPYFRRIPVKIWPGDRCARAFCGRGWGRNEGKIAT